MPMDQIGSNIPGSMLKVNATFGRKNTESHKAFDEDVAG